MAVPAGAPQLAWCAPRTMAAHENELEEQANGPRADTAEQGGPGASGETVPASVLAAGTASTVTVGGLLSLSGAASGLTHPGFLAWQTISARSAPLRRPWRSTWTPWRRFRSRPHPMSTQRHPRLVLGRPDRRPRHRRHRRQGGPRRLAGQGLLRTHHRGHPLSPHQGRRRMRRLPARLRLLWLASTAACADDRQQRSSAAESTQVRRSRARSDRSRLGSVGKCAAEAAAGRGGRGRTTPVSPC